MTGVPRSGTTLCCTLLNESSDCLALHEPIPPEQFVQVNDRSRACKIVSEAANQARKNVLNTGYVVSKHMSGSLPENPVETSSSELRREIVSLGDLKISKALSDEFTLVIKHNALFAALLSELTDEYTVFAIVRNPAAVFASWQTVDFPVNRGRIPMGELYDFNLSRELDREQDRVVRQFTIIGWFFEQFRRYLSPHFVLTYERIVDTDGAALSRIAPNINPEKALNEKSQSLDEGKSESFEQLVIKNRDLFLPWYSASEVIDKARSLVN